MAWRTLYFSKGARLSLERFQLKVQNKESFHVPMEDIACIVLESPQILLTSALLARCAELGVVLFTCDEKHVPNGVLHGYLSHSRHTKVLRSQISASAALRRRFQKRIIQAKIENQARCLRLCSFSKEASFLETLALKVRPGDPTNREAVAARRYFTVLFGKKFQRKRDSDGVNACLNYGYAILRGAVARGLVSHGLLPSLGMFHDSELNAFNLADDMVEPLRPLVDLWCIRCPSKEETPLTLEERAKLTGLLHCDWVLQEEKHHTLYCCERMAASLVSTLEKGDPNQLILPELSGLEIQAPV